VKATASKTDLWINHCAWWARAEVPADPDRPNQWRSFGLAVHDALEIIQQGWDPDLLAIADKRDLTAAQRLTLPRAVDALREAQVPPTAATEVAWAIDLETGEGRELGRSIGRAYKEHGARDDVDFCGSADLAWMATNEAHRGYVVVLDLKSGRDGLVEDHKPQLMSNAAGLARAWGARGAILTVLHLFNGEVKEDTQIVEDFELDAHVEALRARHREIPTSEPNPGPWCREKYCNAIDACPATAHAAEALIPADRLKAVLLGRSVKLRGEIETEEEARARVALLPLVKEFADRYEEECRDWAREHGGVRLAYDSWWGEVPGEKRSIDATPEAMAVLVAELGPEHAAEAVRATVTQTSIRQALVAAGVKPASSALARVMQALERAGAVKVTASSTFDFRKRPPEIAAAPKPSRAVESITALFDSLKKIEDERISKADAADDPEGQVARWGDRAEGKPHGAAREDARVPAAEGSAGQPTASRPPSKPVHSPDRADLAAIFAVDDSPL
jgi:hypothetical protein